MVFYTNKTHTPQNQTNTEYSRRSREVVRGGFWSGQRTDHNAHTQRTIPGYCITGFQDVFGRLRVSIRDEATVGASARYICLCVLCDRD
jgi:hypothetical protein